MSGRGRGNCKSDCKSSESSESSDGSISDSESDMDQIQNSQELDDILHTDAGLSDDSGKDPNYSPSTTLTKGKKYKSPNDSHADTAITSKATPRSDHAKARAQKPIAQRKEIESAQEVLNKRTKKQ